MAEFQNPFFTSTSDDVESEYVAGVAALQTGDCNAASRHFGNAAKDGHVSALFNLSLLWGGGSVTPYDFDLAADCWYKAAEAGHPRAKAVLWQLEAAVLSKKWLRPAGKLTTSSADARCGAKV